MFEGFDHGEQSIEAVEERWGCDGGRAFHLSSGKPHEESARLFGEGSLDAHEAPSQGACLTSDQQAFEDGGAGFLLPSLQLLASLFEQLEVGFDSPPPVIPEGNLGIGNRVGQVAQQEPVGQRFKVVP